MKLKIRHILYYKKKLKQKLKNPALVTFTYMPDCYLYVYKFSALQSLLWYTCETIEIDFTYCENKEIPKVLYFCAYSHLMDKCIVRPPGQAALQFRNIGHLMYLSAYHLIEAEVNKHLYSIFGIEDKMYWSMYLGEPPGGLDHILCTYLDVDVRTYCTCVHTVCMYISRVGTHMDVVLGVDGPGPV